MDLRLPDMLVKAGLATREQADVLHAEIEAANIDDRSFSAIPPPDENSLRGPGRTLAEL